MTQPTITSQEVSALLRQINTHSILVRQLQAICANNGISRSGVKAELRNRIVACIQGAYARNDVALFYRLKQEIADVMAGRPLAPPPSMSGMSHRPNYHTSSTMANSWHQHSQYHGRANLPGASPAPAPAIHPNSVVFKSSPFYETKSLIGKVYECDVMAAHRNTVSVPIRLSDHPDLELCVNSKDYRVMVFCADGLAGPQDIAFPHSSELKVNGGEIKANLRGLKKKPGSTRPVDITDSLRLRASYVNNVEFTYALTNKMFYLAIYVCKVTKAEDLVARIRNGKRILKTTVISELINKSNDPDIETTSQVMSLKCPLSYMRLSLPCRGMGCKHMRCFDCTSYLQLQEQGPQWVCPICNGPAPFDQLAVDEYVLDILSKTPRDLGQVTIELDGAWKVPESPGSAAPRNSTASFDLDDLEISSAHATRANQVSVTPSGSFAPSIGTTPSISDAARESPVTPMPSSRPAGGTSTKRPAAAVIDLTLSSDEDDAPPAPKRQQLSLDGLMNPRSNGYH